MELPKEEINLKDALLWHLTAVTTFGGTNEAKKKIRGRLLPEK